MLGKGFSESNMIYKGVTDLIVRYFPDNKVLANKTTHFYANFIRYFIKLNKFKEVINMENPAFLIIKEVFQDYNQISKNSQSLNLFSYLKNNF